VDSEEEYQHPAKKNRARCVSEESFETTSSGYLSIPHSKWYDLPDSHKTYIQECTAKVKHNESVKELTKPDNFQFHNKARRMDFHVRENDTATKDTEKKTTVPPRKKIRLKLEQSENPEDNDE
jgi:ribosomal protein L44E